MICCNCGFNNVIGSDKQLTRREAEIISYIIKGESNVQIGNHLQISDRTVKHHVFTLFKKLGVHKRIQLIYLWHTKQLDAHSLQLISEFTT